MKTLDLSPLEKFLKEEINPSNCSKVIGDLIELTSILYMISVYDDDTRDKIYELVTTEQSDSIYFLKELANEFSKMEDNSSLEGIEELVKETNNLPELFRELSLRINMMLVHICGSEDAIKLLSDLLRHDYFYSIHFLNQLSCIFADINILSKHKASLNDKAA